MMATINELRLNPVTPTPKNIFAKNPPTTAPTIPSIIDPNSPPLDGAGSIILAMLPAISPNTAHASISIISFSPHFFRRLREK